MSGGGHVGAGERLMLLDPDADHACPGTCAELPRLAREAFRSTPIQFRTVRTVEDGLAEGPPTMVLLRPPRAQTFAAMLDRVRAAWRFVPLLGLVCGAAAALPDLMDSLSHGLDDFLVCPFRPIDAAARLNKLLPGDRARAEQRNALVGGARLDNLVGDSLRFLTAAGLVVKIAGSSATVLLRGETGVGKGMFARAIHYNGPRRTRAFVPVNCSALPDQLFENELFGHARGAYTDAGSAERGLVSEAEGGTLFLDEVDTLSPGAQAKLLGFLQDHEYRPLGSGRTLTADVRVVAATNSDLRALVAERRFRPDLYHRLDVLSLEVPALRERATDIPLLARHFLERFSSQYERSPLSLTAAALRKLGDYTWPGNVRELESVLHRAVVFCSGDWLDAADIPLRSDERSDPGTPLASGSKSEAMAEFERHYLTGLLREYAGNVSQAARASGNDRRTFQRLLRKHGIERATFQHE